MGRHRRATSVAPEPVVSGRHGAGRHATARHGAGRHRGTHRKRNAAPVRTGLLGVSAAVAMGAVAVASGLIPGPSGTYTVGDPGGPGDRIRAGGPTGLDAQGGSASPSAPDRGTSGADRDHRRSTAPSASAPSSSAADPSRSAEPDASEREKTPESSQQPSRTTSPSREKNTGGSDASPDGNERTDTSEDPGRTRSATPGGDGTGGSLDAETAAEARVLKLVNQERAQAGCKPVTADPDLAELAGDYSAEMADRGFFSHTSPDGETPWDRAEEAGIDNLGGENIARGQADAEAVMESWMNSPGHRANILNCDYRTLGVGAHFAEGGPWWTQNFGF
ncbi:CAP domain-containing protein [Streptomyces sp. JJ36]|uniref:CAP domain-containing protein n=1 Tax=Streptomyces sp. JJ36 TaxID=2736645 RepID=UPI001F45FC97|nr:CAP domain-containing protein [Streptomyces sp. JJ36]MCF6523298.1 CAP domain-containing protein [Streptomyces sp. JJ36]